MPTHILAYRYEPRWSVLGLPREVWNGDDLEKQYPCLEGCQTKHDPYSINGAHSGRTVFIYAACSCGWEKLEGDHIYADRARLTGKLDHLQHQIDLLAEPRAGRDLEGTK